MGDLRFRPPKKLDFPEEPKTVFVGSNTSNPYHNSVCVQMDFHEKIQGIEDCLHLNIYVPETKKSGKLPVMFWIHGGGFFAGSASPDFYGPEHFLDHDIILVTINYRLGPLGFLTLGNDLMPGNLGLRDQILALEWVQENIAQFGGDPKKVTIAGRVPV